MHHIDPVASVRGECGNVSGSRHRLPVFVHGSGLCASGRVPGKCHNTGASLFPTCTIEVATFMEALSGTTAATCPHSLWYNAWIGPSLAVLS